MRILLTTDTIGGVWTFTQELAAGLLRRGHNVTLAAFGRTPTDAQAAWLNALTQAHASSFEHMCTPVPLEWMENNELAWEVGARLLMGLAAQAPFDILHSNQFCFGALDVSMPRLITAHSDVLSWERACRTTALESTPWLAKYLDLVSGGMRGAHAITAPTRWMLDALTALYPHLPEWQVVIANGRTLGLAMGSEPRVAQAVSVGRLWDEAKNIRLLAEVNSPVPLLVAGDQQWESAAAPAELGQAVFLGALSPDDLHALFRSSTIYIATSVYEPFGLAPLEAALCGCALLLNDVPSFREVWGENALYFRTAPELSALLHKLTHSADELTWQQRLAKDRGLQFSADRMVDSYISLYSELVDAYGAGQKQRNETTCVH